MYSLPELNDWRGCVGVCNVGGIFSIVVDTVLCGYTMTCYTACICVYVALHIKLFFTLETKKMQKIIFACKNNSLSYPLFPPPTCVPVVPTAGPRQLCGEAVEEVEDCPGKDHYIVHV